MYPNTAAGQQPAAHHTVPTTGREPDKRESIRSVLSTIGILLVAPIIAVLLTAFVFQSYQVDGQSMESTLHNNDRLIIWKLSKTWSKITHHQYVPGRGDVIVFNEPRLPEFGQDPGKQLIKRVIGLPGDHVVISKNIVTVYNSEHPNGFHPDTDLPYDHIAADTSGDVDLTVGKDEVYVLGDNRGNSLDSRFFGPVPTKYIVGKLAIRVLPIGDMKRF